ncbi:ester cyclase [Cystobacter fuscus]|uniref:ester cyclase n=1 Tax=Cystobacter fuscus TaxID=43 RepID=UPI002B2D7E72|nr:ester cyclase [Cystobacter fuscus]
MDATKTRQFYEECLTALYIQRDTGRMAEFYAEDIVSHPSFPGQTPGLKGVEMTARYFLDTFADISFRIESFSQEGETFSCHLVTTGTHVGNFMGIPATGRKAEIVDKLRCRIKDGKIAEQWSNVDTESLQRQLGAA